MDNQEQQVQKNNYFEFRNVDFSTYAECSLPLWLQQELKDSEQKILDFGCGLGQNLNALIKQGFINSKGVDIEKKAIEFCKNNGLDVREISPEDIKNPFQDKFDIIIFSHVIEHIDKNQIISTLTKIKEVFLAEEGKFLIAVPNAQANTNCYWMYEDWTHTTLFTTGSIYYVLKAAGFNNIEFIDVDCTLGMSSVKKLLKKFFLKIYKINKSFWNRITSSSYHRGSPLIFSFEIKVKAYE